MLNDMRNAYDTVGHKSARVLSTLTLNRIVLDDLVTRDSI